MALPVAEKVYLRSGMTSAGKAVIKNNAVTAALKRCATQNQMLRLVFPQAAWQLLKSSSKSRPLLGTGHRSDALMRNRSFSS